jgi:hypothetical protein
MPLCPSCHVAAISVVHTASAVRDLGVAGAVSIAAAPALRIAYKRGHLDGPVAHSAAREAVAHQTHGPASGPGEATAFVPLSCREEQTTDSGLGSHALITCRGSDVHEYQEQWVSNGL